MMLTDVTVEIHQRKYKTWVIKFYFDKPNPYCLYVNDGIDIIGVAKQMISLASLMRWDTLEDITADVPLDNGGRIEKG